MDKLLILHNYIFNIDSIIYIDVNKIVLNIKDKYGENKQLSMDENTFDYIVKLLNDRQIVYKERYEELLLKYNELLLEIKYIPGGPEHLLAKSSFEVNKDLI